MMKRQSTLILLEALLIEGYQATIVGGEEVVGSYLTVFVDDLEPEYRPVSRTAQPGVRLTKDGEHTVLLATSDRDEAQRLLIDAHDEIEAHNLAIPAITE